MKTLAVILSSFFLISDIYSQAKVGINTTTPSAMLHVKDSNVVFTGVYPLPGTPGNPPVSGAGTRNMWYPNKAALRAGSVIGANWDKDSVGQNSIALGYNTIAKGFASIALGSETSASGNRSTAIGTRTVASGTGAFTTGDEVEASGSNSVAMGLATNASGSRSLAMGFGTVASGTGSVAMGSVTDATGEASVALGQWSKASGNYSVAMGYSSEARPYASLALGQYNEASAISLNIWEPSDPVFIIGNGTSIASPNNAVTVLKNGNFGINTASPAKLLHVLKGSPVLGPTHSNTVALFESYLNSYLQTSSANTSESGILSGNSETSIRSALIFTADSSVQIRSGGNLTKLFIRKDGNVGVGTTSPAAKLDINGTAIIGSNGTALSEIIKVTVLKDVAPVAANSTITETFIVANSALGSTAFISPASSLANGLIIAYCRVSPPGTVEVKFTNTTGAPIDPGNMNYYITVIR